MCIYLHRVISRQTEHCSDHVIPKHFETCMYFEGEERDHFFSVKNCFLISKKLKKMKTVAPLTINSNFLGSICHTALILRLIKMKETDYNFPLLILLFSCAENRKFYTSIFLIFCFYRVSKSKNI